MELRAQGLEVWGWGRHALSDDEACEIGGETAANGF